MHINATTNQSALRKDPTTVEKMSISRVPGGCWRRPNSCCRFFSYFVAVFCVVVLVQVPADRTELVPVSIDLGFELHHAEKAYIMLNM